MRSVRRLGWGLGVGLGIEDWGLVIRNLEYDIPSRLL